MSWTNSSTADSSTADYHHEASGNTTPAVAHTTAHTNPVALPSVPRSRSVKKLRIPSKADQTHSHAESYAIRFLKGTDTATNETDDATDTVRITRHRCMSSADAAVVGSPSANVIQFNFECAPSRRGSAILEPDGMMLNNNNDKPSRLSPPPSAPPSDLPFPPRSFPLTGGDIIESIKNFPEDLSSSIQKVRRSLGRVSVAAGSLGGVRHRRSENKLEVVGDDIVVTRCPILEDSIEERGNGSSSWHMDIATGTGDLEDPYYEPSPKLSPKMPVEHIDHEDKCDHFSGPLVHAPSTPCSYTMGFRNLILLNFTLTFIVAVIVIWVVMWYINVSLREESTDSFNSVFSVLNESTLAGLKTTASTLSTQIVFSVLENVNMLYDYVKADMDFMLQELNTFQVQIEPYELHPMTIAPALQKLIFNMMKGQINTAGVIFAINVIDGTIAGYDRTFCLAQGSSQLRLCVISTVRDVNNDVIVMKKLAHPTTGLPTDEALQIPFKPVKYDVFKQSWWPSAIINQKCERTGTFTLPTGSVSVLLMCPYFQNGKIVAFLVAAVSFNESSDFSPLSNIHSYGSGNSRSFLVQKGVLLSASDGTVAAMDPVTGVYSAIPATQSSDPVISYLATNLEETGFNNIPIVTLSSYLPPPVVYKVSVDGELRQYYVTAVRYLMQAPDDWVVFVGAVDISEFFSQPLAALESGAVTMKSNFINASQRDRKWMIITAFIGASVLIAGILVMFLLSSFIVSYFSILKTEIIKISALQFGDAAEVVSWRLRVTEIEDLRSAVTRMRLGLESFAKFVPRSVVKQIVSGDKLASSIYFENRRITVIFSDIANFTTICDTVPIETLIYPFVEYLTNMSNVIETAGGTVGDYMGDGIVAYFGAPEDNANHAHDACAAALQQMRVLIELNKVWEEEGGPAIWCRIGINTGDVYCGNLGSPSHLKYDIIGADVNFGSRLEGLNKKYGTAILVSEATYDLVKEKFLCRPIDTVCVVGMTTPSRVYELMCSMEEASLGRLAFAQHFTEIFDMYTKGDFIACIAACDLFLEFVGPGDQPTLILRGRCEEYEVQPPSGPWTGVTKMDSK